MTRSWIYGVVVGCLVGCGTKHEQCAPAKTAATEAIDASLQSVADQREQAKKLAAEFDPARLETMRATLGEALDVVDRALDCSRLGKESAPGLVPVQNALIELRKSSLELPASMTSAVKPVTDLFEADQGLLSGPQPGIETWCGSMREAIAKMKQDIAPLWEPAKAELQARRSDADSKVAAIRTRDALLREWRTAIAESRPVTLPATTAEDSRVRDAIVAYQSSCH